MTEHAEIENKRRKYLKKRNVTHSDSSEVINKLMYIHIKAYSLIIKSRHYGRVVYLEVSTAQ